MVGRVHGTGVLGTVKWRKQTKFIDLDACHVSKDVFVVPKTKYCVYLNN